MNTDQQSDSIQIDTNSSNVIATDTIQQPAEQPKQVQVQQPVATPVIIAVDNTGTDAKAQKKTKAIQKIPKPRKLPTKILGRVERVMQPNKKVKATNHIVLNQVKKMLDAHQADVSQKLSALQRHQQRQNSRGVILNPSNIMTLPQNAQVQSRFAGQATKASRNGTPVSRLMGK